MKISVDASRGIRKVRGYSRRTAEQIAPLQKARAYMEAANAANFATGGLPSGGWAPLSPMYGAWKAGVWPGRGPLIRTGRLLSEMTSLRGSAFEVVGANEAVFRLPNVEYAKFHQYGTSRMPKRQIVFEPAGFAKYVAEQVDAHIDHEGAGR